jgi:threonine/homoserine/homoserine lactone efflux protein
MAGANGTMGVLMLAFAAGFALAEPGAGFLRILKFVGGLFLLFLAADAIRASFRQFRERDEPKSVPSAGRTPFIRGVLSVVLNPGAWIFLITTASALFATAAHTGGRLLALGSAVAMVAGVASVDGSMVLLGDRVGKFEKAATPFLTPILAGGLAVFGVILIVQGIRG